MVMNIMVEIVTSTSARVSWDAVDFPGISGYIVYYSLRANRNKQAEQSVDVPGSSVIIEDLVNGAEYQFTVVALANLDRANISGSRAIPIVMPIMLSCEYSIVNIIYLAIDVNSHAYVCTAYSIYIHRHDDYKYYTS